MCSDKTAGPGGEEAELTTNIQGGKYTLELEQTRILVYLGEPLPLCGGTGESIWT